MSSSYKKYISYFQRVQTIGVLSCGKGFDEAAREATALSKENPISRCFYDETEWELSDTAEYNPDIEVVDVDPSPDGESIEMRFNFSKKTADLIANNIGKSTCDITSEDLNDVLKVAIKSIINKGKKQ